MYKNIISSALFLSLPFTLAACQGGGSSNSSSISAPVTSHGPSQGSSQNSSNNPQQPTTYSYTAIDPDTGEQTTITGQRSGTRTLPDGTTLNKVSENGISIYTTSENLEHAEFGYIENDASGSRAYVNFSNQGVNTTVPTTGTATYNGKFVGVENTIAGDDDLSGNASISANFSTGNVDGRIKDINGSESKDYDIKLSGTISGSDISGSADLVQKGTNNTIGTTIESSHEAGFHGIGASEVTGVIGTVNGPTAVTGAYGAKKQ